MWKPPEKIKCPPAPGAWPSADEAASSRLFSPLKHGTLELAQRTWIPAMVPWRATEDGEVTDAVVEWYERFAMGRPGAIVVEATGIRDVPSGPLLRIGHDRYIDGLKRIVEAVKRASGGETKLYIQIIDFLSIRRRPARDKFLGRFLRITDAHRKALGAEGWPEDTVREALMALDDEALDKILDPREREDLERGHRERVSDTHLPHIRDLPEVLPGLFANAARRAKEAGFDGVELHYAHAYTMASFLSKLNMRRGRLRWLAGGPGAPAAGGLYRLPPGGGRRLCAWLSHAVRRLYRRRQYAGRHGILCAEICRSRDGFPVFLPRRQVRGCAAAQGGRGHLSLYRAQRL